MLSNMAVSIEQHVEWIVDCLDHLRGRRLRHHRAHPAGRSRVEPARPGLREHHPLPDRQLLVHGGQRPRQAPGLPALYRRRRRLPGGLRRGRGPGLPRLYPRRPGGVAVQRRGDPPAAARRGHGARGHGGPGPAADRVDVRSRTPGPSWQAVDGRAPAGARRRRGRRRRAAGCRRGTRLPAVPARVARSPPDRRLLPRGRLGARQPGLRRSLLPRPVRPVRHRHRVGQLPARSGGPVPGRRRRRLRGRAMDRGPRH